MGVNMRRPVVYIAHPLGAKTREKIDLNRATASRWVAWAALIGAAPVADWIILTGQWEETPENREIGLSCDFALVDRCDELWLCGPRISDGMRLEGQHALRCGVTVRDLTSLLGELPIESYAWVCRHYQPLRNIPE